MTNGETKLHVSALCFYPLKSAGMISVETAELDSRGIRFDRQHMVVDATGRFLTQREHPKLARLRVRAEGSHFRVEGKGVSLLLAHEQSRTFTEPSSNIRQVQVWDDICSAQVIDDGGQLARYLGIPCQLVRILDEEVRQVNGKYAEPGDETGFSDGFPLLVTTEASLHQLELEVGSPIPMDRFRPNVVIAGGEPFAEDHWNFLTIGSVRLRVAKPCARCIVTCIDQETARITKEPLRTLARIRNRENSVIFGQNVCLVPKQPSPTDRQKSWGQLHLHDPVFVE